ncbi:hypothetical protein OPIT5_10210 [Opitutaceae bacterium TAV5]|nr:hypothetical protein OPIT5_10210 [Opitutaceae bacterium TAV5]
MKSSILNRHVISTLLASVFASSAIAQTSVNLLGLDEVRSTGTYTYYARGNSRVTTDANYQTVTPFTIAFNPGAPHFSGTGTPSDNARENGNSGPVDAVREVTDPLFQSASAFSIGSGDLTDRYNYTGKDTGGNYVGYFVGVTETTATSGNAASGSFDIVFDLGASYTITGVEVVYTDGTSHRIDKMAGAQQVYFANSLGNGSSLQTSDLDAASWATTANTDATGLLQFSGDSIVAQYVDLRLSVNVSTLANANEASQGPMIYEVRIYGSSLIPEPSTWAIIGGALALAVIILRRLRFRAR